jgi:Family of unknown function (DUF5996)
MAVRQPWLPMPSGREWAETRATLHLWTQVVGKVRLALAPPVNHWWHVTLVVTARGLTTLPMPCNGAMMDITFDFIDHQLVIDVSDGRRRTLALRPQTVADFYRQLMDELRDLGADVRVWPVPVEIPGWTTRFDEDRTHRSYDAASAQRWWQVLVQVDEVLKEFRGRFLGKCSPVHFFWGGFDHAVTRFSGRRAPDRPGADRIQREGYSHEVLSAGFWPGGGAVPEAAFYAYAAPEPDGFKTARVGPAAAFYSADLGEFILKYEDVRTAASPRDALIEFLETTYVAGATLAGWDRRELERSEGAPSDG